MKNPIESHSQGWFWKNVVQIQIPSRTGLDARLQHLISTLCLIKKKRRPEMKKLVLNLNSWLMTILTIQWKHQRKNNISHYYGTNCKIWSQIQLETTLYTLESKMTVLFALEFRLKCNHFHNWNHRRKGNGWVRWKKQQIWLPLFYDNTIYVYIYINIYMYHIVPIICVNSWLVSTDITFCAPNSLVTESQYLQHFLWSKKWER